MKNIQNYDAAKYSDSSSYEKHEKGIYRRINGADIEFVTSLSFVQEPKTCYLEFAAPDVDDIRNLRSIIGRHVYNKEVEESGNIYTRLVIE